MAYQPDTPSFTLSLSLYSRVPNKYVIKPRRFLLRIFVSVQNRFRSAKVSDCLRNASVIASFPLRIITRLKNTCKHWK